jgi:hypothetical protein
MALAFDVMARVADSAIDPMRCEILVMRFPQLGLLGYGVRRENPSE